jgi:hypothetical protein
LGAKGWKKSKNPDNSVSPNEIYLVGGIPTPLKNMSSSVGIMTFPTEWKNKIHVPNHQPVYS